MFIKNQDGDALFNLAHVTHYDISNNTIWANLVSRKAVQVSKHKTKDGAIEALSIMEKAMGDLELLGGLKRFKTR